jgi:hypothetical protein
LDQQNLYQVTHFSSVQPPAINNDQSLTLLCLTPDDFTRQGGGGFVVRDLTRVPCVFHHVTVDSACEVVALLVTLVRVL